MPAPTTVSSSILVDAMIGGLCITKIAPTMPITGALANTTDQFNREFAVSASMAIFALSSSGPTTDSIAYRKPPMAASWQAFQCALVPLLAGHLPSTCQRQICCAVIVTWTGLIKIWQALQAIDLSMYTQYPKRLRTRWSAVRIRPGAHCFKKYFRPPGPADHETSSSNRRDNKTVRQPGAAPGWTPPRKARRRSAAKRRTRGLQAPKQSVRAR